MIREDTRNEGPTPQQQQQWQQQQWQQQQQQQQRGASPRRQHSASVNQVRRQQDTASPSRDRAPRHFDGHFEKPRTATNVRSATLPNNYRGSPGQERRKGKKFLRQVQDELEGQRAEWKGEVEKMIEGLTIQKVIERDSSKNGSRPGSASPGAQSYVDTSTGRPIYKAFVDVSEYPPQNLSVTIDHLQNKLIVSAQKGTDPNNVTRTFTQKVQLPRYADEQNIRTKLNRKGVLTIEVPLLFYFEPEKKKAKSFINEIKTREDGTRCLEILVNVGDGIRPWEVKVRISEKGELLIHAEKEVLLSNGQTKKSRQLIKRYILPENADPSKITSKLGEDGRLAVTVPLTYTPFNTL